jgi:hypothetical protein
MKVNLMYRKNSYYDIDETEIDEEKFDNIPEINNDNLRDFGNWLLETNYTETISHLASEMKFADPVPEVVELKFIDEKDLDKFYGICNELNILYNNFNKKINKILRGI